MSTWLWGLIICFVAALGAGSGRRGYSAQLINLSSCSRKTLMADTFGSNLRLIRISKLMRCFSLLHRRKFYQQKSSKKLEIPIWKIRNTFHVQPLSVAIRMLSFIIIWLMPRILFGLTFTLRKALMFWVGTTAATEIHQVSAPHTTLNLTESQSSIFYWMSCR